MRLAVLLIVVSALLLPANAAAHRLDWFTVRAVAIQVVDESAAQQPEAVGSGIASRCWRRGNHDVGCPVFMQIDHVDEFGSVRHLRCTGLVEAIALPTRVEWRVSDLPCDEVGPPPPAPSLEQLQALNPQ